MTKLVLNNMDFSRVEVWRPTYLLSLYHEALENHNQVDVIHTDFSKALDSVSHMILERKRIAFGFHGGFNRWLIFYLPREFTLCRCYFYFSSMI